MQRPLICTAWQNFAGRKLWTTTRAALSQKPLLKNIITTTTTTTTTTTNHVPSTLDVSTTLFTSQQHSRPTSSFSLAASQAVRLSLRAGNIADAFRVVNAARRGGKFDEDAGSIPASFSSALHTMSSSMNLIPTTPVPPSGRLPTHTLLHGLVRLNKSTEAGRLVDEMMKVGMKVRVRSLEAVFASLGKSSQSNQSPPSPRFHSNNSKTLSLALALLQTARKTRTRKTHRMIKTLLALALLNGEIVLASLLFGGLVREWRGRKMAESMAETSAEARKEDTKVPYPAWSHLAELCGYIDGSVEMYRRHRGRMILDVRSTRHPTTEDERYLKPPDPPPPRLLLRSQPRLFDMTACHELARERFSESIQALANVAGVLLDGSRVETEGADGMHEQDHQKQVLLPFGGLAGLIKVLYQCLGVLDWAHQRPSTKKADESRTADFRVWIREHNTGQMKSVEAGKYLRGVMRRFVMKRLPWNANGPGPLKSQELTQQTYNTLLYYALVHAGPRSREMADRVLESIVRSRKGSNQVTMNIIEGVVKRGIRGDNRGKEQRKRWVGQWKARLVVQPSPAMAPDLSIASLVEASSKSDGYYTLSTKIGACVANGRPDVVAGAVPYLLPGLMHWVHPAAVDSPTALAGGSDFPTTTELLLDQRKAAVMRAVRYGPVVMTSMLSALVKAGKTGLVERVWGLAREAQRVSWDLGAYLEDHHAADDIVVRPWCLGIEAYTVVIQAYANESRKVARGKDLVAGWAQGKSKRRRRSRAKMGRHMGIKTSRLVGTDPAEESASLQERLRTLEGVVHGWMDAASKDPTLPKVKVKVEPKHVQPLVPDVHFFNAVLDIFGRAPPAWSTTTRIRPRSTRCLTRKKARTRYLGTVGKYVWEGRVMGYYHGGPPDPRLREVVAKIRDCGFGERIPLLVKRILVGRGEGVESGGVLGTEGKVWMQ